MKKIMNQTIKKYFTNVFTLLLIAMFLFSFPLTIAEDIQAEESESLVIAEDIQAEESESLSDSSDARLDLPDPGVTPDDWNYFLDVAADNIGLALTGEGNAKIERRIEIAEERLAEAKEMGENGEVEGMKQAEEEHARVFNELKEDLQEISNGDAAHELEQEVEIERKVKEHSKKVQAVKDQLRVKITVEGELSPEHKALIESILKSLEGQTGAIEIEIKNEKSKSRIKYEHEYGEDGKEYEYQLKQDRGYIQDEVHDVRDELAEAEEFLRELIAEAKKEKVTLPKEIMDELFELIQKSKAALEQGHLESAEEYADHAETIFMEKIEPLMPGFMEHYFETEYQNYYGEYNKIDQERNARNQGPGIDMNEEMRRDYEQRQGYEHKEYPISAEEIVFIRNKFDQLVREAENRELTIPQENIAEIYSILEKATAAFENGNNKEAQEIMRSAEGIFEDKILSFLDDEMKQRFAEEDRMREEQDRRRMEEDNRRRAEEQRMNFQENQKGNQRMSDQQMRGISGEDQWRDDYYDHYNDYFDDTWYKQDFDQDENGYQKYYDEFDDREYQEYMRLKQKYGDGYDSRSYPGNYQQEDTSRDEETRDEPRDYSEPEGEFRNPETSGLEFRQGPGPEARNWNDKQWRDWEKSHPELKKDYKMAPPYYTRGPEDWERERNMPPQGIDRSENFPGRGNDYAEDYTERRTVNQDEFHENQPNYDDNTDGDDENNNNE